MPRKLYSTKDLENAVAEYNNGTKMKALLSKYPQLPRRTITDRAKRVREDKQLQKTGPAPVLSVDIEEDLKD